METSNHKYTCLICWNVCGYLSRWYIVVLNNSNRLTWGFYEISGWMSLNNIEEYNLSHFTYSCIYSENISSQKCLVAFSFFKDFNVNKYFTYIEFHGIVNNLRDSTLIISFNWTTIFSGWIPFWKLIVEPYFVQFL